MASVETEKYTKKDLSLFRLYQDVGLGQNHFKHNEYGLLLIFPLKSLICPQ